MKFSKSNLLKLKRALLNLGEMQTDGGLLIYDGDNLEVGAEVFVEGEEGLEPAKDGVYTYQNQVIEVVGGIVNSITDKGVEQPTEETETKEEEVKEEVVETAEEEKKEEEVKEETETTEEVVEEPETETQEEPTVDELKAIIEEQKTLIESLKAENEELKKKLEEPAAEPAEEEFKKVNPEKVEKKIDFSKYIKRK